MFKRLFFAMLGLGAGIALGIFVVRKLEATQRALRPDNLAASAAARAGGVRSRWATAVEAGRKASEQKEAELRAVYRASSAPQER
ncbi:MAG: hypothetical protein GEU74_06010 [Nitriliruptorales bacterium]|nr:hypothetical protein [Nitriliruptorales bacterium]